MSENEPTAMIVLSEDWKQSEKNAKDNRRPISRLSRSPAFRPSHVNIEAGLGRRQARRYSDAVFQLPEDWRDQWIPFFDGRPARVKRPVQWSADAALFRPSAGCTAERNFRLALRLEVCASYRGPDYERVPLRPPERRRRPRREISRPMPAAGPGIGRRSSAG